MRYATDTQITEAAKAYGAIGRDSVKGLYAVVEGDKKYLGLMVYRDTFSNLAKMGVLVYNGDYTYSATK